MRWRTERALHAAPATRRHGRRARRASRCRAPRVSDAAADRHAVELGEERRRAGDGMGGAGHLVAAVRLLRRRRLEARPRDAPATRRRRRRRPRGPSSPGGRRRRGRRGRRRRRCGTTTPRSRGRPGAATSDAGAHEATSSDGGTPGRRVERLELVEAGVVDVVERDADRPVDVATRPERDERPVAERDGPRRVVAARPMNPATVADDHARRRRLDAADQLGVEDHLADLRGRGRRASRRFARRGGRPSADGASSDGARRERGRDPGDLADDTHPRADRHLADRVGLLHRRQHGRPAVLRRQRHDPRAQQALAQRADPADQRLTAAASRNDPDTASTSRATTWAPMRPTIQRRWAHSRRGGRGAARTTTARRCRARPRASRRRRATSGPTSPASPGGRGRAGTSRCSGRTPRSPRRRGTGRASGTAGRGWPGSPARRRRPTPTSLAPRSSGPTAAPARSAPRPSPASSHRARASERQPPTISGARSATLMPSDERQRHGDERSRSTRTGWPAGTACAAPRRSGSPSSPANQATVAPLVNV